MMMAFDTLHTPYDDEDVCYHAFLPPLPEIVHTTVVGWEFLAWFLLETDVAQPEASTEYSDSEDLEALDAALAHYASDPVAQDTFVTTLLKRTDICFKADSVPALIASETRPQSPETTPDFYTLYIVRQTASRRAKGVGCVKNWATARRSIAYDMCRIYQEAFDI
ncbi:MAG: hypothetical protein ACKO37_05145 [Vampirovibrionales bacterium]